MYPTKETLSAFIDGELAAAERERVAAIVESDPKLKIYVAEQERLRASLHAAFAGVLAAPVPDRLLTAVASAPLSFRVRLRHWLGTTPANGRERLLSRFAVPAVTMALGLILGVGFERNSSSTNDFISSSSGIMARAELEQTLDQGLASNEQNGATRVGVTFHDRAGAFCRSFEVSRDSATTDGFACHRDGAWEIRALVSGPSSRTSPTYSLASSSMPDAIRDAITAEIQGAPLDSAAERRARDRGWN